MPASHIHRRGLFHTFREAISSFLSDRCATLAAGIAFYSAFSLAPTLLIVLAVAGWFFGPDTAQGRLFGQIKNVTGPEAASAMQDIVAHAHRTSGSGIATILSVVFLVVGASATFSSLNSALNLVFKVEPPKGISGFAFLLRARLISFALVMGFGFLLVVSLVLDAAIQTIGHTVLGSVDLAMLATALQFMFGLVVLTAGFGILIKWLPDRHVPFDYAFTGGLVSAMLFSAGRHLFGFYLSHAQNAGSFAAAGSLAMLMLWLFFSAAVFLLGAELSASIMGVTVKTAQSSSHKLHGS
ncbi:membrane protein [Paraburkholderia sp. GAS199]|uniref:YihY/virulence factor BrkB family protein n=1 Tax=Paraburkholderia sp. GAS199 TaxID=3035126 RepID=UPI003D257FA3